MAKVLLLTPSLSATPGGITRYARTLLDSELLRDLGFGFTPVTTHAKRGTPQKVAWAAIAAIRILLEGPRHDIAHALIASHASGVRKLALLLEAQKLGLPTVAHFQSSSVIEWLMEISPAWRRRMIGAVDRADAVVTLGGRLADYFRQAGVRSPIHIIPNGVPNVPERRLRSAGASRYLLAAGELGERKGTFDLLAAFAKVHDRWPNVSLFLAGDGAVGRARDLAAELGITGAVKILGWVDPLDLQDLLAGAEAFVLPSYREGMSFAVLEALMQGVPVVATPAGEQSSVIQDRQTGLLVEAGNVAAIASALGDILGDPALALRLGRAGRLHAQTHFTLRANHASVGALYRTLLRPRNAKEVHKR